MADSTPTLHAQALEFVEAASEALTASQKLAQDAMAQQEKIAAAAPGRVDMLIDSKLVDPLDRQAALDKLASHEGSLEVIGSLTRYIQKQATELAKSATAQGAGVPVSEKTASSRSQSNYVGRRLGLDEEAESDRVYEERLGLR